MRRYLYIGIVIVSLSGCASAARMTPGVVEVKEGRESAILAAPIATREEGSLWSELESVSLYPDRRARRAGDIVNIRIVEDPEANLNANTSTSRKSDITAAKLKFLGYMKALAESNKRLAQNPGQDDLLSASLGMQFDGTGSSDRDSHVKAYVPAMVEKVFQNGNLFVSGKREIRVNNETEYITISGIIRVEDIDQQNEISSSYVADAKISYSGKGVVADNQKPGWLMGILNYVWPF